MFNNLNALQSFDWQDLSSDGAYLAWKEAKIKTFIGVNAAVPIRVESLEKPSADSVLAIKKRCANVNFAVYEVEDHPNTIGETSKQLLEFAGQFGLKLHENHRSAGEDGVVALQTSSDKGKRGYIPYTPRPLNWHTDGYYNDADNRVLAFALHCFHPAAKGGQNQLIDPEIAYIRLRDENPAYVQALFHPEAMTIPFNVEENGQVRPDAVGPVFFHDASTGRLQMRYTARTRSIAWRNDTATQEASEWLREWLTGGDELMVQLSLKAGQGVLNNNVLHNRTGFVDDPESEPRTMMRVRFHSRISEE